MAWTCGQKSTRKGFCVPLTVSRLEWFDINTVLHFLWVWNHCNLQHTSLRLLSSGSRCSLSTLVYYSLISQKCCNILHKAGLVTRLSVASFSLTEQSRAMREKKIVNGMQVLGTNAKLIFNLLELHQVNVQSTWPRTLSEGRQHRSMVQRMLLPLLSDAWAACGRDYGSESSLRWHFIPSHTGQSQHLLQ